MDSFVRRLMETAPNLDLIATLDVSAAGATMNATPTVIESTPDRINEASLARLPAARPTQFEGQISVQALPAPAALIITFPDQRMTITEWNDAAEKLFGYTREEAVGQSALDLTVRDEDRRYVQAAVSGANAFAHGTVGTALNKRKDGSTFSCRWVSTLLRDAQGRAVASVALAQSISDQVRIEEHMRLWASVIEHSMEAIMICDSSQRIVLVNKAFEEITGFRPDDVIGKTPRILQSGLQSVEFYKDMWREVAQHDHWRGEIWNRHKSGELYVEWLAVSAVRNGAGEVSHYIGLFSDITARKQAEESVRRLAHFDPLTHLPNRSLLMDRAGQALCMASRANEKFALMFIDLDRFKNINDSMGHAAGDELLRQLARRLLDCVRSSDTVARVGGDEFVIVLTQILKIGDVAAIAQKLLAAIGAPIALHEQEITMSASIGICIFPDDATDVGTIMRNADAAMYDAKSSGRNRFQFYTREMNERALEKLATENALRRALQCEELVLHYQPQFKISTGELVGFEALIRWNRPSVGLVPPDEFIPIAEERGLIGQIDHWALRESVRQIAQWRSRGLRVPRIAVNVSAHEFHQLGFFEQVRDVIREYGVPADCVELEITEGVAMRDTQATINLLKQLHEFGVHLSIDDFGTGFSSLNYLRCFPVDKIKIDRSFIHEMLASASAMAVVQGIVGLAKCLDLEVIAEAVETEEQLHALQAAHCDLAQGFLMGRPRSARDCEDLLPIQGPTDRSIANSLCNHVPAEEHEPRNGR
jgi:diguanylate cyclase (GGDEF)-like protein/PAS domain S-box-containing protein